MPTYEYRCSSCEHTLEAFQSISAEPLTVCPRCSAPALKRLIGTGAGFIFKGSGFYITDYRSKDYKEKAKAETGAGTTSSGSTSTTDSAAAKASGNGSKPPSKDAGPADGKGGTAGPKAAGSA
jgi:putative FmdB family regulatory protein